MPLTYTEKLEQENRMLRSELMRLRMPIPTITPSPQFTIPREIWRTLMQLAHPDKHGNRPIACRATQWLLEHRP